MLMHALAASCEELRARTGNPPLAIYKNLKAFELRWFHTVYKYFRCIQQFDIFKLRIFGLYAADIGMLE